MLVVAHAWCLLLLRLLLLLLWLLSFLFLLLLLLLLLLLSTLLLLQPLPLFCLRMPHSLLLATPLLEGLPTPTPPLSLPFSHTL